MAFIAVQERRVHWQLPGWSTIRDVARSRVIGTSAIWLAIVPVAVTALQHMPEVVNVSGDAGNPLMLKLGLPFSWKLLWFAGLSGACAQVTYLVFCPSIVRSFETFSDYWESASQPIYLVKQAALIAWRESFLPKSWRRFQPDEMAFEVIRKVVAGVTLPGLPAEQREDGNMRYSDGIHIQLGGKKLGECFVCEAGESIGEFHGMTVNSEGEKVRSAWTMNALCDDRTEYQFLGPNRLQSDQQLSRVGYQSLTHYARRSLLPARATVVALLAVAIVLYLAVVVQSVVSVAVYLLK